MREVGNFLSLVALLAVIFLLVRPSSYGPALIQSTTQSFAKLLHYSVTG